MKTLSLTLLCFIITAQSWACEVTRSDVRRERQTIIDVWSEHRIDPNLGLALAFVESSYRWCARSGHPAYGLFQLTTDAATDVRGYPVPAWALFDPKVNAEIAARWMLYLLAKYSSLEEALHVYRWGATGYARGQRDTDYVNRILRYRFELNTITMR